MHISDFLSNPLDAFIYAERYVNDGSPSGFTFQNGASDKYRPMDGLGTFDLPIYEVPWEHIVQIGTPTGVEWAMSTLDRGFVSIPIHPDVIDIVSSNKWIPHKPSTMLRVCPTASTRTVMIAPTDSSTALFVKLHFPRLIGRFVRSIPLYKWISSVESSQLMKDYIASSDSRHFSVFDEFCAMYIEGTTEAGGFGTILRKFPTEFRGDRCRVLIPSFALFSKDTRSRLDPTLLAQILVKTNANTRMFLEEFIWPLITYYHHIATTAGLLPELNAQNLLFGLNDEGHVSTIAVRDMEDLWKDLSVRTELNLTSQYASYHTICRDRDPDYFQRRSFLYDFKLAEYVIRPLVMEACHVLGAQEDKVLREIQDFGHNIWQSHKDYFRPIDRWYCYPKTTGVSRSTYRECEHPWIR